MLRPWRDADLEPFAALNTDSRVMEFFPAKLTRGQSDHFVEAINQHFDEHGYGLWAVETQDAPFIGYIGLWWSRFESWFTPQLEVGFRLAAEHWGKGYATEGGRGCVQWVFDNLNLPSMHSWTAHLNKRSVSAIQKIGLKKIGDFDHPRLAPDDRLRPHSVFRVTREEWAEIP